MSKSFERFKEYAETLLFNIAVVDDLPSIAEKGTIYLIVKNDYEREEYLWVDDKYVLVDVIETEEEKDEEENE